MSVTTFIAVCIVASVGFCSLLVLCVAVASGRADRRVQEWMLERQQAERVLADPLEVAWNLPARQPRRTAR